MPREKAGPGSDGQRASDAIVTQLRSKIMTLELEPGRMVTDEEDGWSPKSKYWKR